MEKLKDQLLTAAMVVVALACVFTLLIIFN